jgi:hypothetical protein
MIRRFCPSILLALATLTLARADDLDTIGLTALLQSHPELTGNGQTVAQVEADVGGGAFEVNSGFVGLSPSIFTYFNNSNPYPTGTGFSTALESSHANGVGSHLFGATTGVAPGVSAVQNFDASYFYFTTINNQTAIAAPIVNQSFIFDTADSATIATANRLYDSYANRYGTLFINGLKNDVASLTNAPASMYNGIAVGRVDGQHSGRAQIVAPGGATSFATPYVTGAAVVLRQAAVAGAFSGTNATDSRLIKAGLLNGATKTVGWSHTTTDPLDATYGSGVLNVSNSFNQLSGGQHTYSVTSKTALGTTSTNTGFLNGISSLDGWDLRSLTTTMHPSAQDSVNHYFFDLSTSSSVSLTATLTWNSVTSGGSDTLNNFDLVLVNSTTGSIVWQSVSTAYNVEQVYATGLSGAKYDLQVILRGGSNITDTYAVVWSWTSLTAVPESDSVWMIGVMGFVFILARRLRRHRV